MTIKFPKTIQIGTTTFKVTHDKRLGGEFNWDNRTLRICDKKTPLETLNIITHEVFEMWAVALYLRYERPDSFNKRRTANAVLALLLQIPTHYISGSSEHFE